MIDIDAHQTPPLTGSAFPFGSQQFREYFRNNVAGRLNGTFYALANFLILIAIIGALAIAIPSYERYFLLLLPVYFLFVNGIEYTLHRFPMHHKTKGFEVVYEHVTIHHNFFADRNFYFEQPKDYYAAILPYYIFIGLTLVITAVSGLIYVGFGLNNALFFALVAYAYYLLYELLHFSYHTNENSFVKKIPFLKGLARQHILHHQTRLMAHYNFNITFPIFDWLFHTNYKEKDPVSMP